jgi:hypothetical protein
MALSWWLKVEIGMFLTAWVVCVTGWAINLAEWRRFRAGHVSAAGRGFVLSSRLATKLVPDAKALAGVGGGRATWASVLLFPLNLPYASSLHPCRVFWFGRALVGQDQVRVEARIPVGATMFVIAWMTMAILMAVMLVSLGAQIVGAVVGSVAVATALGYRYTFRRERDAAERFVEAFASCIVSAV